MTEHARTKPAMVDYTPSVLGENEKSYVHSFRWKGIAAHNGHGHMHRDDPGPRDMAGSVTGRFGHIDIPGTQALRHTI